MYGRILFNFILVFILASCQVAFVNSLPWYFSNMNIFIPILLLLLGLGNFSTAVIWSLFFGLFLDIYMFAPFGIYTFSLFVTIILTNFLLTNFFTNRSFYAFAMLTFYASVFNGFVIFVLLRLSQLFNLVDYIAPLGIDIIKKEVGGIVLNVILLAVLFNLFVLFSGKFKPVFLVKKKY